MQASSSKQHIEGRISTLLAKKEELRAEIGQAVDEQDDVLAAYEQFVKWLGKHENDTAVVRDFEILEVLEEAVRTLKDDNHYKRDLRYVKLWTMYARRVRKPETVYSYLFTNAIGTSHSQLYEECALVFEEDGRHREAEEAFKIGLRKSSRAVDRLKTRYKDFQNRVASGTTLSRKVDRQKDKAKDKSTPGALLYRDPLKNFTGEASSSSTSKPSSKAPSSSRNQDPAGSTSAPAKRAEHLHIDLSLLERDGVEMSIQEARAASLGLLNRHWGPPPEEEKRYPPPQFRDSRVDQGSHGGFSPGDDDMHTRHLRLNTRLSMAGAGEPTVTINTKEALRDVFGMYNSPDKTTILSSSLGSKHSLVRKVEPVTPANLPPRRPTETPRNENQPVLEGKTPSSFLLFVDDELRKENATPAVNNKLEVFCDDDDDEPLNVSASRQALAPKQTAATPSASAFTPYEDDDEDIVKPLSQSQSKTVFSRVFTPVNMAGKTTEMYSSPSNSSTSEGDEDILEEAYQPPPTMSVFSRPPISRENSEENKHDVFGSNAVSNNPVPVSQPPYREPVFRRKSMATGQQAFIPQTRAAFSSSKPVNTFSRPVDIDDSVRSEDDEEQYEQEADNQDYYEDYEEEDMEAQYQAQAPMGGRLGRFDVMTPIAERTMEYTMSTRTHTPTHHNGAPADSLVPEKSEIFHTTADAADAAQKLALELQREDDMPHDEEDLSDDDDLVEKTCNLSLADAIVAAASFKPSNPCNPTDPKIVSALLSMVPPETEFHDLVGEISGQFDDLQRFAAKLRRNSGKSTSSKSTLGRSETYRVSFGTSSFEVVDKLGEGGFGIVFMAREVKKHVEDDSDDEDSDEEDSDEETDMVAIKVMRPRNIWEFHVLRRVHSVLQPSIRTSVITPHALYAYRDESFLILDVCTQGTLLDVVNRAAQAGVSQQGGCLDELLVVFFTIELLKFVEALHSAGFVHGDLKIDNCLLRLQDVPGGADAWSGTYQSSGDSGWKYKGIKMIDFGRTVDTNMFPSGQQFMSDWDTTVNDCLEMRMKVPWTYQTDYYGLAGIIYSMLFGKHFEPTTVVPANFPEEPTRYKLAPQFKRYWQVDTWTKLFDLLLNPMLTKENGSLPIVSELTVVRTEMETWLTVNCNRSTNTLKGLLKKIERSALSGLSR